MNTLHISLFGKFEVSCQGEVLTDLDLRRVQQLFCYLLLYRNNPHPREALASLLWDDPNTERPIRALRKTLWQLRTVLDSRGEPMSDEVLIVEPDWVQINPQVDQWLDVDIFEKAYAQTQGVRGRVLDTARVQILQNAVELYRGGLQESWYQDWYLFERERFQHMYLIMLDKLMGYCEANGENENGLSYGSLILRSEKARERTHRRLIRLYYLAGDRTAALRQYQICVDILHEELGVEPDRRTKALYLTIQKDQLEDLGPLPVGGFQEQQKAASSPLPAVLGRLMKLQTVLEEVQQQVQQEIEQVKLTLNGRP